MMNYKQIIIKDSDLDLELNEEIRPELEAKGYIMSVDYDFDGIHTTFSKYDNEPGKPIDYRTNKIIDKIDYLIEAKNINFRASETGIVSDVDHEDGATTCYWDDIDFDDSPEIAIEIINIVSKYADNYKDVYIDDDVLEKIDRYESK